MGVLLVYIEEIFVSNYKRFKQTQLTMKKNNISNVLIGPNNSGKTSLIEAISKFLSKNSNLRLFDVPLNKWEELNQIFENLALSRNDIDKEKDFLSSHLEFKNILPSLKLVINYELSELPLVKYFLSDLKLSTRKVSFTIVYEPKDIHVLLDDYEKYIIEKGNLSDDTKLDSSLINYYWPSKLKGFMESNNNFQNYFEFKSYISNPLLITEPTDATISDEEREVEFPYTDLTSIDIKHVHRLISVDTVAAGRYLGDVDDKGQSIDLTEKNVEKDSVISKLLTEYANKDYQKEESKMALLTDLERAVLKEKYQTEQQLKVFYENVLGELIDGFSELGYPGLHGPEITVSPKIEHTQSLKKEASILLSTDSLSQNGNLPENYNGLGYRQLLYIYLKVKSYTQKFEKEKSEGEAFFHILLIEEPEANLHAPVQRILIREIENMVAGTNSQVIMSTHSNHILDQMKFEQLHYLSTDKEASSIKYLLDKSLVNTGVGQNNDRFVQKYFELHSHDMFYADGIIVVEGQSEKNLIPHYIKNSDNHRELNRKYIAVMNIGGAYAHKFFPLFELLGKPILLITDLDSYKIDKKVPVNPSEMSEQTTTNSVLGKYFDENLSVKELIEKTYAEKVQKNGDAQMRIAYQYENHTKSDGQVYARTFEDAFALKNKEKFKTIDFKIDYGVTGRGLLREFKNIFSEDEEDIYSTKLFEAITGDKKSDFALDIIHYLTHHNTSLNITEEFHLPDYIDEGLSWLNEQLGGEGVEC